MNNINNTFSQRKLEPEQGVLYIVGTPIGNLNDISPRAINILSKVSFIACEDTRNTKKLMNNFNISNKLVTFNDHNAKNKLNFIISKLKEKNSVALVSDAGMPLISDPGEILISKAKQESIEIISISGPCAAISALVCSGLSTSRFIFIGFLPRGGRQRKEILEEIRDSLYTIIIYESPKRVIKLLEELKIICGGERKVSISREITKKFEQNISSTIENAINFFNNNEPIGEFTLIISPFETSDKAKKEKDSQLIKNELVELINAGLSHSASSNYLSKKYKISKNKIYNLINKDKML